MKEGALVKWIPPYCYHLSPLDNGAFGYVCKWLQNYAFLYATKPVHEITDAAFSSVGAEVGRMSFHQCYF